ncbi:DNA-processing protein DprA [Dactylosporangium sp. CA-139066]|uniref:DNA-processing protein DprA n=1 Tax=Dactylosporangium sp. CA-139066 TaxID=3239930 RepID=UPI003D8F2A34
MAGVGDVRVARATLAGLAHLANPWLVEIIATHQPVDALARLAAADLPDVMLDALPAGAAGPQLLEQAAAIARQTARAGARVVIPEDDEWPQQLPDLAATPGLGLGAVLCLWVRSDLPQPVSVALRRAVAVVGARAATSYGMHVAEQLGTGLADAGWTIVSTGGFGIDTAALRGALAGDGIPVAVLAAGVDQPRPYANRDLFDHIAQRGMLLSLWPPGTTPQRARYTATAALVATLTTATVLVEASARSRALTIVQHAIERDRPTMVVPGPVTSAVSDGAHHTLRTYPQTRLVRGSTDVLAELAEPPATA